MHITKGEDADGGESLRLTTHSYSLIRSKRQGAVDVIEEDAQVRLYHICTPKGDSLQGTVFCERAFATDSTPSLAQDGDKIIQQGGTALTTMATTPALACRGLPGASSAGAEGQRALLLVPPISDGPPPTQPRPQPQVFVKLSVDEVARLLQDRNFVGMGPRPAKLPLPLSANFGLVFKEDGKPPRRKVLEATELQHCRHCGHVAARQLLCIILCVKECCH